MDLLTASLIQRTGVRNRHEKAGLVKYYIEATSNFTFLLFDPWSIPTLGGHIHTFYITGKIGYRKLAKF